MWFVSYFSTTLLMLGSDIPLVGANCNFITFFHSSTCVCWIYEEFNLIKEKEEKISMITSRAPSKNILVTALSAAFCMHVLTLCLTYSSTTALIRKAKR